jgi:hypothetical protein
MEQSPATFRSGKVTPRIGEAVTVAVDRLWVGQGARIMRKSISDHKATGQANCPSGCELHESDEPPRRNDADPQQE